MTQDKDYKFLQSIGEGAYGKVYKAIHLASGKLVAIKVLNCSQNLNEKIKNQLLIMLQCSNQHVVNCYGSQIGNQGIWIVMEYCSKGSVLQLIKHNQLTQYQIATILKSVLLGLQYLHSRKKIHRDVKAANIMLNQKGIAKLGDFGVAGQLLSTFADKDTFIGSPFWMSPQILSKTKYNSKTDIWSLGITAIQMAQGHTPYSNIHPFRAMFLIQKNPPKGLKNPQLFSSQFVRFVKKCLTFSPDDRPSAKQLLMDPFITSYSRSRLNFDQIQLRPAMQLKNKQIIKTADTLIQHPDAKIMDGPIIWEQIDTQGTIVVKDNQSVLNQQPDFIRYIKENSKKQTQNIQNIKSSREQGRDSIRQFNKDKEKDDLVAQINALKKQKDLQIQAIKQKYNSKIQILQNKLQTQKEMTKEKNKLKLIATKPKCRLR